VRPNRTPGRPAGADLVDAGRRKRWRGRRVGGRSDLLRNGGTERTIVGRGSQGANQEVVVMTTPRTVLDAQTLRDWVSRSAARLEAHRHAIDHLNVFPVPDGDTGTNLYLTLEAATTAAEAADNESLADAVARGALVGARGNSGVIVSQWLRGLLTTLGNGDANSVAQGLSNAARDAWAAVSKPVPGTILSVASAAAEAASAVGSSGSLADVVRAAAAAARTALERTPDDLAVLRDAGVVDAGGRGLVLMLESLDEVVSGQARDDRAVDRRVITPHESVESGPYEGPAFEVMYLLEAAADRIEPLREALAESGDSLVIVGGEDLWNVHVHVDDAGAAVEAGLAAGRPYRIRISHLAHSDRLRAAGRGEIAQRSIVVVSHGDGTARLVTEAGATVVPAVGQQPVTVAEILVGVHSAASPEIVILPSDRRARSIAEAAAAVARDEGTRIAVIPTRSIVQSIAALAVHDPSNTFDEDVVTMTRAAGATRYAALTVATKAALTWAGPCAVGDVLGIVNGDVVEVGAELDVVAKQIIDRLVASGGELVTLVTGADAPADLAATLRRRVGREHPGIDVVVYDGGQPLWPLIVGVE